MGKHTCDCGYSVDDKSNYNKHIKKRAEYGGCNIDRRSGDYKKASFYCTNSKEIALNIATMQEQRKGVHNNVHDLVRAATEKVYEQSEQCSNSPTINVNVQLNDQRQQFNTLAYINNVPSKSYKLRNFSDPYSEKDKPFLMKEAEKRYESYISDGDAHHSDCLIDFHHHLYFNSASPENHTIRKKGKEKALQVYENEWINVNNAPTFFKRVISGHQSKIEEALQPLSDEPPYHKYLKDASCHSDATLKTLINEDYESLMVEEILKKFDNIGTSSNEKGKKLLTSSEGFPQEYKNAMAREEKRKKEAQRAERFEKLYADFLRYCNGDEDLAMKYAEEKLLEEDNEERREHTE